MSKIHFVGRGLTPTIPTHYSYDYTGPAGASKELLVSSALGTPAEVDGLMRDFWRVLEAIGADDTEVIDAIARFAAAKRPSPPPKEYRVRCTGVVFHP